MTLQIDTARPAPIIRPETCIVCQEITFETCNQCGQPIHHTEENSEEISCWVLHWKPSCKDPMAGVIHLTQQIQTARNN